MQIKTILKLIAFNAALALFNFIIFSKYFVGLRLTEHNVVPNAIFVLIIALSAILFFLINFLLIKTKPPEAAAEEEDIDLDLHTLDDCSVAVTDYIAKNVKTFHSSLNLILTHIQRMKKKKKHISDILSDRFEESELSYQKFSGAVTNIEEIMVINIRSMLDRITVFDEDEYEKLLHDQYDKKAPVSDRSEQIFKSRMEIFYECKEFVQDAVDNNEEMLIRLDKLLIEITKLNRLDGEDIDQLEAMKEIDDLIHNTKWYR